MVGVRGRGQGERGRRRRSNGVFLSDAKFRNALIGEVEKLTAATFANKSELLARTMKLTPFEVVSTASGRDLKSRRFRLEKHGIGIRSVTCLHVPNKYL